MDNCYRRETLFRSEVSAISLFARHSLASSGNLTPFIGASIFKPQWKLGFKDVELSELSQTKTKATQIIPKKFPSP